MYKKIYKKLEEKSLNPFPLGVHKGECEEKYCVIKKGTQIANANTNKLGVNSIDIILFVPLYEYTEVEEYANKIRNAMKEIKGLRKTGLETPVIVDDEKKAYTMSIEYVLQKRLEG